MPQSRGSLKQEPRKALVIGVSDYINLRALEFCKNDGNAMIDLLAEEPCRYKIEKLIGEVNAADMKNAINTFFLSKEVEPKDILLFYFSGHGIMDDFGHYYLAPTEIDPIDPIDTKNKGFSFDNLQENIEDTHSRRVVIALDCCYSGAAKLREGIIGKGKDNERAAKIATQVINKKMKSGEGKCILSACLDSQEAESTTKREYSIFTQYLLEGFKGNDEEYLDKYGNVTTKQLGYYIYDKIINHQPRSDRPKQRPIIKTELSGDIILAHYPDKVKQERTEYELQKLSKKLKRRILRTKGAYKLKRYVEEFTQSVLLIIKRKNKTSTN